MHATSSAIVIAIALALALGSCRATTYGDAEPVGYTEVTSAPVDLSAYPHTYYDGRDVYYVHQRWMYRDHGRWAYYEHEPPALQRQRMYIQQAPPAYPEAYPPPYPPPATRVR